MGYLENKFKIVVDYYIGLKVFGCNMQNDVRLWWYNPLKKLCFTYILCYAYTNRQSDA
jgi:hypothetical protein